MSMQEADPFQLLTIERWDELEKVFEADWPRGISALTALRTQRHLENLGLGYGFKVYCPYGKVANGMVAFNKKGHLNEIIIQCPDNDTSKLEAALVETKIIDWNTPILVPYMPENIIKCINRVAEHINVDIEAEDTVPNEVYIYDGKKPSFKINNLPKHFTFKPITEKDIPLIDSTWRNRYNGSDWFFQILTRAKFGFGLYKEDKLLSWVFNNEVGALTHLFTLDAYRGNGFAQELVRRHCNTFMGCDVNFFAYCRKENTAACKLFEKLGFEKFHEDACNEIIIQCPGDDTTMLERALTHTNLIDWTKSIMIPCLPDQTFECIQRVATNLNMEVEPENEHLPHYLVVHEAEQPLFGDIQLPEGIVFQIIPEEYIELVNSVWPNRYNGSIWMFQLLFKAKSAYGLFKKEELISCVFINEIGVLMHMFTFETYRNKGYAKILMKLVCNERKKLKENVFGYCKMGNINALKLYENLGFKRLHFVKWGYLNPRLTNQKQIN